MDDNQLEAITGVPRRVLIAIRMVESRGRWDAVRFEPHIFWRLHKNLPVTWSGRKIRDSLTPEELVSVPYTPGPTGAASHIAAETNRAAVDRAMAIDAAATVRATSWGAWQDLGAALLAEVADPATAVAAFDADPQDMSGRLFARWVKGRPHFPAVARSLDFDKISSLYNGCSDCTLYSSRLRAAYNAAA